jgi:hypothetical protein
VNPGCISIVPVFGGRILMESEIMTGDLLFTEQQDKTIMTAIKTNERYFISKPHTAGYSIESGNNMQNN